MTTNSSAVGVCPAPATASTKTHLHSRSTSTEAQIARLLAMLRTSPRHTHELRRAGVSHPAGRIFDLQRRGYRIDSSRVSTVDGDGYAHFGVARYSLLSEPEGERGQCA